MVFLHCTLPVSFEFVNESVVAAGLWIDDCSIIISFGTFSPLQQLPAHELWQEGLVVDSPANCFLLFQT